MKKIIISILLILMGFILLPGCKKFLEVVPKGSRVAATTSDYALLMNAASFYEFFSGGGWTVPVLLGDEIAAEQSFFNSATSLSQNLFRFSDVIYQPTDNAADLSSNLSNLYVCNKVINEVLTSSGGTSEQKQSLRAEALATRAWINFQFINFYARPYLAATAATDPGFPIITRADATQSNYSRSTVKEVYDAIIADLNEAIPLLPIQNTLQTRMNKAAAEGILGKVYLFMGRNTEALTQFNAAFTDNAASSTAARLYNYNSTLAPGGSFLPIGFNGPNSPYLNYNDFTESLLAKSFYNSSATGNNGIVLAPQTAALFSASDLRLKFYSATFSSNAPNPSGRLRKYNAQYSKFGLQISELYLLRAEANARLTKLAEAQADVETLRKNRMPVTDAIVPATIANNQNALIRFIFDERLREFAAEGYRWFDMRRQSVDPIFSGQIFTHTLYLTTGGTTVYTLDQPNRLVLRIPPTVLMANPSFTDNP